jgi:hypothetical protein
MFVNVIDIPESKNVIIINVNNYTCCIQQFHIDKTIILFIMALPLIHDDPSSLALAPLPAVLLKNQQNIYVNRLVMNWFVNKSMLCQLK